MEVSNDGVVYGVEVSGLDAIDEELTFHDVQVFRIDVAAHEYEAVLAREFRVEDDRETGTCRSAMKLPLAERRKQPHVLHLLEVEEFYASILFHQRHCKCRHFGDFREDGVELIAINDSCNTITRLVVRVPDFTHFFRRFLLQQLKLHHSIQYCRRTDRLGTQFRNASCALVRALFAGRRQAILLVNLLQHAVKLLKIHQRPTHRMFGTICKASTPHASSHCAQFKHRLSRLLPLIWIHTQTG